MPSYQYRKSHCWDKTMLRPSYLHNGISYTGKMTSLYWIGAQAWITHILIAYFTGNEAITPVKQLWVIRINLSKLWLINVDKSKIQTKHTMSFSYGICHKHTTTTNVLGPVSIKRPSYLRMAISMLKIRRPLGRLIFNMGIATPGKTVFLIETAPRKQYGYCSTRLYTTCFPLCSPRFVPW